MSLTKRNGRRKRSAHKMPLFPFSLKKTKIVGTCFFAMTISMVLSLQSQTTVKDIEGNVYTTIEIGSQIWTVENLRTTKYNDGTSIPYIKDNEAWINDTKGGYCFYKASKSNIEKYGLLYNWHAVNTGKLAMKGWRVPTKEDYKILIDYLIANGYNYDKSTAGNKIAKSLASKNLWNKDVCYGSGSACKETHKNNTSGFNAVPAGYRNYNAYYLGLGENSDFWTATEDHSDTEMAYFMQLKSTSSYFNYYVYQKIVGRSIRLVKDQ